MQYTQLGRRAVEAGINFFDTADMYSTGVIARARRKLPARPGHRQ